MKACPRKFVVSEQRVNTANERVESGSEEVGRFCSDAARTSRPRVNGAVLRQQEGQALLIE